MPVFAHEIHDAVLGFLWPFLRVSGLVMAAPVLSARIVPMRVRLVLAVALTALVAPLVQVSPALEPLSPRGVLVAVQQILLGVAMGLTVQMVFDAMVIGGQTIAMSMGLGFATLVDPQRGVSVPVLGQFFVILELLMFLALDGHLALIGVLADSFQWLPVGAGGIDGAAARDLVGWGSQMLEGAMRVALPAVAALLVVNLAFGVMSRAAPTLNLFAVGFPVTITLGFVIVLLGVPSLERSFTRLLADALEFLRSMLGG